VTHRRARRLLHALPDGLVPARTEFRVRQHAAGCARCRGTLLAIDASEALLRRLPTPLVPQDACAEADARLAVLARWSAPSGRAREPAVPLSHPVRWGVPAVGFATAAACLAAVLFVGAPSREAAPSYGSEEAFNFVLASSLAPSAAPTVRHVSRAGAPDLAVPAVAQRSDHYYLPIGVR
jgi:anti-sigma factor RsiW